MNETDARPEAAKADATKRLDEADPAHVRAIQFLHDGRLAVLIEKAADSLRVDRSTFLRTAVEREALRALAAQSRHVPTEEGARQFAAAHDGAMPPDSFARLPTPGRSVAGVDGCRAGWVAVRRDSKGGFAAPMVVTSLDNLPPSDMTVIDVPIGLPESGKRACDLEARELLGRRWMTVFTGVRRPLLTMKSYEEANAWGKRDGEGLTRQMWNILAKIRGVDDWITPERNRTFREGHPELSFMEAAGRPMAKKKKERQGEAERLDALARFVDRSAMLEWLEAARGSGAGRDDILDATALCRTAARVVLGYHWRIPDDPPRDARGLPMEMVF